MFNSLQEKLESAFKNIKGQARVTELNIASTVKDIRRALVDADVNYKIAKEFTDKVKEKALGEKVINSISPGQLMVKIVKDELVALMGGTESELNAKGSPAIPMSYEEVAEKFMDCAAFAKWPKNKAQQIVEMVRKLETLPNVRTLTALCAS